MNSSKQIALPIIQLALPLILIQLCQASMGLINTLIAGRYYYLDLAAVGLGSNIWAPVFILCTGMLYVLVPKFAYLKHQADDQEAGLLLAQAKKAASILSVFGFLLLHLLAVLCPYFIHDPQVALITQSYLHYVAFGIPALVFMVMYRFVSEGNSELMPIILTFLILVICDGALSAILVNGLSIFPEMGGAGSGLATAISAYLGCFVMRSLVYKRLATIKQQKPQHPVRFSEALQLLKQGLPIGIALVLQILALATLAFFAAQLGTKVIAAHQIVINIAMVIIMIPVAISNATTIRIAYFSAAENQQAKLQTGLIAAGITLIYGAVMALLLILFAPDVLSIFTHDPMVIRIASGLIIYTAIFLFFDAFQTVASGVLRGLQKFMPPLLVILLCYWLLIIPLSYFASSVGLFHLPASVEMIWIILASGIMIAAFVMTALSYKWIGKTKL